MSGVTSAWDLAAVQDGKFLLRSRGQYDRAAPRRLLLALRREEVYVDADEGRVPAAFWHGSSSYEPDGILRGRPDGVTYHNPRLVVTHATASPKPQKPRPQKPEKRKTKSKAQTYLAWELETYPGGAPAGTSDKALASQFLRAKSISISVDTIRRATGRK